MYTYVESNILEGVKEELENVKWNQSVFNQEIKINVCYLLFEYFIRKMGRNSKDHAPARESGGPRPGDKQQFNPHATFTWKQSFLSTQQKLLYFSLFSGIFDIGIYVGDDFPIKYIPL